MLTPTFRFDPITLKYTRLNKAVSSTHDMPNSPLTFFQGVIHGRLVTAIRFHPLDPTLIYVLYSDGLIMTFSTEREDPEFKVTIGTPPWANRLKSWENGRRKSSSDTGTPANTGNAEEIFIWRNDEPVPLKGQQGSPYAGRNPVAVWKLGDKMVKGMEFSPDGQALAAVSEDGTLKIVDTASARYARCLSGWSIALIRSSLRLLDTYGGYFGGLTCLAWSPDGKYVVVRRFPDQPDIHC